MISGEMPVPVRAKVYGFSFRSSFAIVTVAVFAPALAGENVIVKVAVPAGVTGEPGCAPTTNIAASVPLIATLGVPPRFRFEVPRFSTVKVIAVEEAPTRMLPNP